MKALQYVLDPFRAGYHHYSLEQDLQEIHRQKLIEEERRRWAAVVKQALIAAYERERAVRAARENAYQRELAERRRRQYQEYYESQVLNTLLGNLLFEEDNDEKMADDYLYEDCDTIQCRKRARLCASEPKHSYRYSYHEPRSSRRRQYQQNPQEQQQVWLLVQHLKDLDDSETTEAPVSQDKGKGKAVEKDTPAQATTSSQAVADSEDQMEDTNQFNVDVVMDKLQNIGERLDRIQEEHEVIVLATPLTFDTESEEVVAKSATNRQFLSYEDDIMKVLLELDAIESHGLIEVRNRRKELVAKSENLLKVIDDYKQKEWERASSSSVHESDDEVEKDTENHTTLPATEESSLPFTTEDQVTAVTVGESEHVAPTPESQENAEFPLPVSSESLDESMQVDNESQDPIEDTVSSSEGQGAQIDQVGDTLATGEQQSLEIITTDISEEPLKESTSELPPEDVEFEKVEYLTGVSEEPSNANSEQTTHTADNESDFEMVDDQDLAPQHSTLSETDSSSQNHSSESSKPIRIDIEWADE
ncbi:hypothetical protein Unana1_05370 [Umbelopsis nana]